jgi:PAS domain S-box-containing protein
MSNRGIATLEQISGQTQLLDAAINASKNGIIITDWLQPDNPIIFCNKAFEDMTGYLQQEIIGRNCRFLQGEDREQKARYTLKNALQNGEPCNVELANYRKDGTIFWNEQVKSRDDKLHCIVAKDENHTATLATVKQYDTGMTLYYIPVRPLWHWVNSKEGTHIADLLLGIFAYLHQVVGIPFYSESGSYLASEYDYIEQMVDEEQDEEPYRQKQKDELYVMKNAGIKLLKLINDKERLAQFEPAVLNFRHTDKWELDWELLAIEFLQLYQAYPKRNIFDNIHSGLLYPADEDRISADQYISFYWSGDDCLAECLFEMINAHFQEIAYMDEPMRVHLFDKLPENGTPDFDFETRLFDLINQLSKLLSDYDYEEREPSL